MASLRKLEREFVRDIFEKEGASEDAILLGRMGFVVGATAMLEVLTEILPESTVLRLGGELMRLDAEIQSSGAEMVRARAERN